MDRGGGDPAPRAPRSRVAFGDWQTPLALAEAAIASLDLALEPATILEPTCGRGAFLAAASARFPRAELVGFDVSADYVAEARRALPSGRARVEVADFFGVRWRDVIAALEPPLLIVGNPPWVTSAAVGALAEPQNLPVKSNVERRTARGIDALMGKSNFDISEWMVLALLDALEGRAFTMGVLCKRSVARRIALENARRGLGLRGSVRAVDARLHFQASVDAVWLELSRGSLRAASTWPVFEGLSASTPSHEWGVDGDAVIRDLGGFRATRDLEGHPARTWRSGVKHDCARVMELEPREGVLYNGFGERVDLEADTVFPLLKGSDLGNRRTTPRRAIAVPQRDLSEDTATLETRAPKLHAYLVHHGAALDARKSRIYRGRPRFSIFGVGDYSFSAFKVAIGALYKRLDFSVVGPIEGKPVLFDDTVYFYPCADEREAERVARALNGPRARAFFEARVHWDAKRPIAKALLDSLAIERLIED